MLNQYNLQVKAFADANFVICPPDHPVLKEFSTAGYDVTTLWHDRDMSGNLLIPLKWWDELQHKQTHATFSSPTTNSVPLRVTARLATPIAVYDDFTPNLENLLMFLLLDRAGRASPNPTPVEVEHNRPFVEEHMPLQMGHLGDDWYWKASTPWYLYEWEHQTTIHKRWDCQEQHLDWQGKRRSWSTSEGHTKGYTIVLFERMAHQIDWFCVGDPEGIKSLLLSCHNLGKKRRGQVVQWQVQEIETDQHLWGPSGQLMKPIPVRHLPSDRSIDFRLQNWAWRPPAHMIENTEYCAMPWNNAVKLGAEQLG